MLTFNVYDRVFEVRWNGATGTAFTSDIGGRQYLISAKHVFDGLKNSDQIELFLDSRWKEVGVTIIGQSSGDSDVIVLTPSHPIGANHPLALSKGGVILGQDVFFVGFPFGLHSTVIASDGELHLPLVKKACLSGCHENSGNRVWLLDGFNNPGFSGGPVIAVNQPAKEAVFGIISGYRFSEELVHIQGKQTDASVRANTGIIYAYSAAMAIDLIEKNPTGIEINNGK